jgi:hypothetical protein
MARFARKWTPAQVINCILAAAAEDPDLSYSHMRARDPALVRAAEREFGAWGAAVEAAGFDYETIRRYRRWTRERVIARIRELHVQGADLSWYMVMTRVDPPLAAAALHGRRFASWSEALHAAGLDPRRIARYQRWSPELIHQEVHKDRRMRHLARSPHPEGPRRPAAGRHRSPGRRFDRSAHAAQSPPRRLRPRQRLKRGRTEVRCETIYRGDPTGHRILPCRRFVLLHAAPGLSLATPQPHSPTE